MNQRSRELRLAAILQEGYGALAIKYRRRSMVDPVSINNQR